ncbi:hypothetical protein [Mucilaginibacter jinjuensis]|uniref:DUF4177 domain-containing protein n=1 Tax=Mucilaginibacter jinjuensis TaxID=1176721 RepID=A0ABY7T592_9SPHI|nr:hypothetical protein [Mucilaginibacter jinjuensis]WCT11516.1 hypothetical protein PQO05_22510 [Mucilaginibacter jinjuensis]
MKKLFLLLLFVAPAYCFAQTDSLKYKPKEEFCEAETEGFSYGYRLKISKTDQNFDKVPYIKNTNNKPREFNSMIGIMNYMAQDGWVLVTSYPEALNNGLTQRLHLIYKRPL